MEEKNNILEQLNFNKYDYVLCMKSKDNEFYLGIIEKEKENEEKEKIKYLKVFLGLEYDILKKLEEKINSKSLVKIVNFISESKGYYCDTELRKDILLDNLKRNKYNINIEWKIKI